MDSNDHIPSQEHTTSIITNSVSDAKEQCSQMGLRWIDIASEVEQNYIAATTEVPSEVWNKMPNI